MGAELKELDIPAMQKVAELCGAAVMQSEKLAAAEREIEDFGKVRAGFAKRATEAAKVLAERGVLDSDDVNTYVDKVAGDMSKVWDTVVKMAGMISAPTLGGVSDVGSQPVRAADDPFIREFLPGTGRGNGYID